MTAFVGRASEVDRVRQLVDGERGGSLTITGEPGIGKTALVTMACDRAAAHGLPVLRADADELGMSQPYGVLQQLIPGLDDRALDADLPPLAVVDRAIAAIDRRCPDGTPPLVALDNLQWADPLSLRVLTSIVRRTVPLGWRFVLASRPTPTVEALDRLLLATTETGGAELVLAPLAARETAALVRELAGAPPSATLLRTVEQAGGNPFYIATLVRELQQAGRIVRSGSGVHAQEGALPTTLNRMIVRRARSLGPAAFHAVCTAAVCGRTVGLSHLARVVEQQPEVLGPLLRTADDAGLVRFDGSVVSFRHDLVVAALHDELTAAERQSVHQHVLTALRADGQRLDRRAPHLLALPSDPDGIDEVVQVAMACSPDIGLQLIDKSSAELAATADPEHALTIARATLLLWSGRLREAVDAAAQAVAEFGTQGTVNLLLGVEARGRFLLGESHRELLAEKPDDLEADGVGLITPERYKAEMALGVLFGGNTARARALAEAALAMNEGSIEPDEAVTEAVAAGIAGILHVGAGEVRRGLAVFERMSAALRHGPSEATFAGPELFHTSAHLMLGNLALASAAVERDEAATDYATTVRLPIRHAIRAAVLFERGDWESAVAEAEASVALSDELGVAIQSNYSTGVLTLVHLFRGDLDAATGILSTASGGVGMEWAAWAHAAAAEARGDIPTAAAVSGLVVDGFFAAAMPLTALQVAPRAARLAIITGADTSELRRMVQGVTVDVPSPVPMARRAWALGWLENDTDAIERAAFILHEAGYVVDAAAAQRDVATRRGRPTARPRRADSGATFGWDALSEAEHRVLDLLAEGLDNAAIAARLLVSRRTVESHLSHVYTKLGVTGRSRLVAEVVRRRG